MPELVLPTHEHGAYATEGPFGWGCGFLNGEIGAQ